MLGQMQATMEKQKGTDGCITITRIFDAPREKVWAQWTEPMQYKCWWGPKDFTSPYANLEVRRGGKFLVSMQAPDGKQYWDTGKYEEVVENQRLVYTDTFADENGNVVPASYYGMGSDKPLDMEVEVTLEDIGGQTKMILEHCGFPEGDMLDNARQGWNQSLDKLASCLR
ncbi:MAG: ATPase [Anaerolineales bacterium]|nr:SRPBCC domain-containing protein [Anaerolineae bacterium]PWB51655.1 MAG: ATPase [Anaerolineales bacterium]